MKLNGHIYRGQAWDPMPGSTVDLSDQTLESGLTDGFQSQPVAGLYRGQAYGSQLTGSFSSLSRSAGLVYRGVQTYVQTDRDPVQDPSHGTVQDHAFLGIGIPVEMGHHLASTHHENVMYLLQRRMQSARERGDMELLHQLELEQQA
jgi:hypothetical protein